MEDYPLALSFLREDIQGLRQEAARTQSRIDEPSGALSQRIDALRRGYAVGTSPAAG